MINKRASISSIAEIAGVSPATVSRVLNHPETVRHDTLEKVRNVLKQYGFHQESASGSSSQSPLVLVCLPSIANPFYSAILKGIKSAAHARGFHILLLPEVVSQSTLPALNEIRQSAKISGIITLSAKMDETLLETLDSYAPVIQCCEYNSRSYVPYVGIDDFGAAISATNYLITSGRNKIAFVNGPLDFNYAQERLRGFEAALSRFGIDIPGSWKLSLPSISYDVGYASICQLLSGSTRPNAIFAASDVFAIAALRAAMRYDLKVPQDLSIVGFDNIDITAIVSPTITTISQPCFQIGFTACESLASRMANPDTLPRSILLDTELVVRESSRPCKGIDGSSQLVER